MECTPRSRHITHLAWGRVEVEGERGVFRDAKLFPGGARAWDWRETGTDHVRGIQPADVEELLERGAKIVVLSQGMLGRLRVSPETLRVLEARGVPYHVLSTAPAVRLYNELVGARAVGGLFHSTC